MNYDNEARAERSCSMGVGCGTAGACYAKAHGRPEECPSGRQRPAVAVFETTPTHCGALEVRQFFPITENDVCARTSLTAYGKKDGQWVPLELPAVAESPVTPLPQWGDA